MSLWVRGFAASVTIAYVSFFGCGSDTESLEPSGGTTSSATNGTGYSPLCNDGAPDGFCNSLGQNPESCECLDCVTSAFCNDECNDNGSCEAPEDCSCADCFGALEDCTAQGFGGESNGPSGPSGSGGGGSGGMMGSGGASGGMGGMPSGSGGMGGMPSGSGGAGGM